MRSTYPDYFVKQKTTDTLPYSTREAHFANYTNKLKLQIGARTVARNWSTGGIYVCLGGLYVRLTFKFDKNSTNL